MMDLEGGVHANHAKVRWVLRNLRFFFGCLRRTPRDLC